MKTQNKTLIASSVKAALYGTTALLSVLGTNMAFAQENQDQETSDETVEIIEVKGIRGALATAAELKRESSTFVDSITASDANALPDLSVAEALSRVPGVTVTRVGLGGNSGDFPSPEGSGNLIRGLGFVRSEFNGRDAFSANGGRALDWSAIPPQLIGGVDVYKNQAANLIEGGIGGTINLRTLEPFDNQDGIALVAVDGTYTDLREEWAPQLSGVFGKNFELESGKLGFVASVSTSELKSMIHGYQTGAPIPRNNIPESAFVGDTIPAAGQTVGIIGAYQLRTNEVDRERDSLYFAGQFRSDDGNFEALVKYIRVENAIDRLERTTEWLPDANTVNSLQVSDVVLTPFNSEGVARCNGSNEPSQGDCDQMIGIDGGLFEQGMVTDTDRSWFGAYGAEVTNQIIGRDDTSQTDDVSINLKWRPVDQWVVEFDAHHTTAEATFNELRVGSQGYLTFFHRPDLDNPMLEFGIDPRMNITGNVRDGGSVQVPYQNPTSPTDLFGYRNGFASDTFREGDGNLTAAKLDLTYEFDDSEWFESVKFGARRSEREQLNQEVAENWAGVSQPWIGGGFTPLNALEQDVAQLVDFSDFFRGGVVQGDNKQFVFLQDRFVTNPEEYWEFMLNEPDFQGADYSPYTDASGAPRRSQDGSFTQLYDGGSVSDIVETTTNLYAMLNFSGEFDNGMWLDGNIGVRYVKTKIESQGQLSSAAFAPDEDNTVNPDGTPNPLYPQAAEDRDAPQDFLPETAALLLTPTQDRIVDDEEDFILPSINLKLNLNDDMLIRFGASKGITRPNIGDVRSGQTFQAQTSRVEFPPLDPNDPNGGVARGAQDITLQRFLIQGGNPNLKSTEAVNLDISYEWYWENGGFITLGLFKKDLKNIIQFGDEIRDPITIDGVTVNTVYRGQINLSEADLTGAEIAYQDFFDTLPGIWQHFGVQANYTYIDANAVPPTGNGQEFRFSPTNLLGQSRHTANLIGIYQDDNLEVRLAYNWRSEHLSSYREFVTGNPVFQNATGQLDASIRYQATENLNFSLLIANITDEKIKSSTQIDASGRRYQRSSFINDRRFQAGITYKF